MDVFKAIADPKRREMIALLASNNAMTISALSSHFADSRQAITKHINVLTEAGLIDIEQQGRSRYCHLNLTALEEAKTWIDFYHTLWENKLDSLENFLNKSKH